MAVLSSKLVVSLVDQITGPARGVAAALDGLNRRASRTTSAIMGAGGGFSVGALARNLAAIGLGYVGVREGIGGTVGAAMKFEEAFADVRKVVDGTPAQLSVVRSEILGLSKELPVTADGLASIYAAAGQSGVALQELTKFSEMAAKVSVAWDTSQGETGDALAKIKTQLGFNVDQIGLHADAINHLANNTASAARDLVEFDKRVAATGKMFGFSDTQTLAFGASMISAGAEAEVAATSFRNMGRALTKGEQATKSQRLAFAKLGLDSVKVSKNMQKDALKTTLNVIERIQQLPKDQHISIASALFGDEARALMPIIADTKELRRELAMIGSEANYSGSAFQEYMVRAETTANALQLLGNKIKAYGIGVGDSWLPTIKDMSLGIGDVLDTLDKRVGVIDKIEMAVKGLMSGFGYGGDGGTRQLINDLGDLLFGEAFKGDGTQVDQRMIDLAKLSNNFRKIGLDLKAFAKDIGSGDILGAAGNISEALSKMSGSATVISALGIAAAGAAMLTLGRGITRLAFSPFGRIGLAAATAITLIDAVKGANSIGEFADNLTKLSLVDWVTIGAGLLAVAGPLLELRNLIAGTAAAGAASTVAGGGTAAAGGASTGWLSRILGAGGGTGGMVARGGLWGLVAYGFYKGLEAKGPSDPRYIDPEFFVEKSNEQKVKVGSGVGQIVPAAPLPNQPAQNAPQPFSLGAIWDALTAPSPTAGISKGPTDVSIVDTPSVSISNPVQTMPSGTQDVRVTNPQPAPVVTVHMNVQTGASPEQIASQTAQAVAAQFRAASGGAYSDGGM
ncbi:phage tail tape measure protein [Brucella anthropi]|uniref:Phage tail tape measure protein, TP901 family n=1 Tax=Brucella anthropi (strain ATCC 49188 / DSM 6882 / CCUG 24695 / JCM 21032 / LMG 3331 / NBRC 15819 / NCTC 12168 / Alc 37) TaxID=439375 RepID=A6X1A4_BRUA4|nr:phage tail tape measure protein [Brucella anthropi]ABS15008.1 phage tail tape measure protein, TP901 family [Brucella anthropi ATCC 49188]KAB2783681.1 phage tail tape measure protein [Brucella anthropi]QQC26496.1 phage tail tape measure protein [Brucella anthropi]SUA62689.1 phage tail tape measure protein, TP901 family, core region [Brucella anthropi]